MDSLSPTPCQYVTQLNVYSKHLRLTEIMFISLSTKYSSSRWCNKNCELSSLSEIQGMCVCGWGGGVGGKINRPGQLAPHPLSMLNPTEYSK